MGINVVVTGGNAMYGAIASGFGPDARSLRIHGFVDCNRFASTILLGIGGDPMDRLQIYYVGMTALVQAAQSDQFQGRMFDRLAGHFAPRAVVGMIGCFDQGARSYRDETRSVRDAMVRRWSVANIVVQDRFDTQPRFIT